MIHHRFYFEKKNAISSDWDICHRIHVATKVNYNDLIKSRSSQLTNQGDLKNEYGLTVVTFSFISTHTKFNGNLFTDTFTHHDLILIIIICRHLQWLQFERWDKLLRLAATKNVIFQIFNLPVWRNHGRLMRGAHLGKPDFKIGHQVLSIAMHLVFFFLISMRFYFACGIYHHKTDRLCITFISK